MLFQTNDIWSTPSMNSVDPLPRLNKVLYLINLKYLDDFPELLDTHEEYERQINQDT